MKRLKMIRDNSITFEQGCELYLNNCRERNLRQDTIRHYKTCKHQLLFARLHYNNALSYEEKVIMQVVVLTLLLKCVKIKSYLNKIAPSIKKDTRLFQKNNEKCLLL